MVSGRPASQTTLERHILEHQRQHPDANGELSIVLTQIAFAGKIMAVHGFIRLADGLRVPLEFDADSRRKPVITLTATASESAERTPAEIVAFFDVERPPASSEHWRFGPPI
jgi:hypothetical protein